MSAPETLRISGVPGATAGRQILRMSARTTAWNVQASPATEISDLRLTAFGYAGFSAESPSMMLVSGDEYASLLGQIQTLQSRLSDLERAVATASDDTRNVPDDVARSEIAAFFERNDGEAIYPSDVAEALKLDYEQAKRVIQALEAEGRVVRA